MKSSDDCTEIMKNAPFVPKATCSNHIRLEKICAKPPARHRILCSRMWISVNEGTPHLDFEAIGPAEFRVEKLELDKVFRSLQDYLGTMPFSKKIRISSSWEALRQTLESIPGR